MTPNFAINKVPGNHKTMDHHTMVPVMRVCQKGSVCLSTLWTSMTIALVTEVILHSVHDKTCKISVTK